MATMANWNGHTFEVGADLIRSFEDLTIKGSCETEDKKKSKQGYVKRKQGQPREISFNLPLSALLGVTNVRSEAMAYVNEASNGETAYFYIGTKKLIKAKVMLTSAEISEVVTMPGKGEKWISCVVKMTFKQATQDNDGGSSSGSGKKKKKKRTRSSGNGNGNKPRDRIIGASTEVDAITGAAPSVTIAQAKAASKGKIAGSAFLSNLAVAKKTQTTKDTSTKTTATTGRKVSGLAGIYAGKTSGK